MTIFNRDANPVVAIVDPMSTGAWLAPEFHRHRWRSVAVLSGTVGPTYAAGFRPSHFDAVLTSPGDTPAALGSLAAQLAAYRPAQVIPGCEWGVNLADDLAALLGVPGNVRLPRRPRRAKDAMMRRVAEAGLRVPLGTRVVTAGELDDWLGAAGIWPVVVKPIASAGSDGVIFCADAAQARAAFDGLQGTTNALGLCNDAVLVQQRLVGQQYFVNSVSMDGRHYIHEMWRDDRLLVDSKPVYDRQSLMDPVGDVQDQLVQFVLAVLAALGVRNGPAHTELCVDEHGPVLIECGARLEGGVTPKGPARATGHSQVSLTVERYTAPGRFAKRIGARYSRERAVAVVCLVAPCDGSIDEVGLARLAGLPSVYCGSALALQHGAPVRRTVDLFTSPGHVYLVADDPRDVDHDYLRIRELEANGLYRASRGAMASAE